MPKSVLEKQVPSGMLDYSLETGIVSDWVRKALTSDTITFNIMHSACENGCMRICNAGREKPHLEVERVGEAKNPGPGTLRAHRRGRRSFEAIAARWERFQDNQTTKAKSLQARIAALHSQAIPEVIGSQSLLVWHINIQGLRSHVAELVARLRLSDTPHRCFV